MRDAIKFTVLGIAALMVTVCIIALVTSTEHAMYRGPKITPQESTAIVQGQVAQQQAAQSLQLNLDQIGQPVPDYGSAPGCTPNGCVATLTP